MKQQRNSKINSILIAIIITSMMTLASGKTIYVDYDAAGANNGSSWENAYNLLQDALADARDSDKPVEIRVAQGIYTPDRGANNFPGETEDSFNLINDVTLAGGYAGKIDPNARDIELYETILSGDLLGNDEPVADPRDLFPESEQDSRFDNAYNVVTADNTDTTAVLDGFTITGGIASDDYINRRLQSTGGGLYCNQSSPVITNCRFISNAAREGGAMYNLESSPTLINCRFEKNSAIIDEYKEGGFGGGIFNYKSSPVLTNCIFTDNYSNSGGGMYNFLNSQPVLTNCKFTGNSAKNNSGGGMTNYYCSPILTDCLFESNSANVGGGLHNSSCIPILTGCTFIENHASSDGGGIANVDGEPNLIDCEFKLNIANSSGGAIFTDSCMNLTISNCTFTGNSAYSGSAIQNWYSDMSITGSSFAGNTAFDGAAMQNWFSDLTITNCLFTGNASQQGCTIQNYECNLTLTNCTISGNAMKIYNSGISDSSQDNQDTSGEPPALPGMPNDDIVNIDLNPGYLECTNCIIRDLVLRSTTENTDMNSIFNNYSEFTNIKYSNIPGGFDGPGNIDDDPLFVNPGHWAYINDPNIITGPNDPNAVWINGDYHLKSQAGRLESMTKSWIIDGVTSPCIDAGDPNSPVGDEPQPNGGRINMGAYGGTQQASISISELNNSKTMLFQKKSENRS